MTGRPDLNGLVTVDTNNGLDAAGLAALQGQSEPSQVSISSLIDDMLRLSEEAVSVYIDPARRKVASAAGASPPFGGISAVSGIKKMVFTPEADQTGRSLTWEVDSTESGFDASLAAALEAATDPVKPKKTAASLVSALYGVVPDGVDTPVIVVSQLDGTVTVYWKAGLAAATASIDVDVSGENPGAAAVTLSEPTGGSAAEALVFEGGAT